MCGRGYGLLGTALQRLLAFRAGAYTISKLDNSEFDIVERVFKDEKFEKVSLYGDVASLVERAIKNNRGGVVDYFDSLLASSKDVTTTQIKNVSGPPRFPS